ncbi:WxL domain-containing protein [Levilactobacillus tujiorum]|uniref:WxL domain-containing protein n=1 Tax=Levilactobacillus tujiorum TaxID=2912243 RepID=A0ABX1L5H1_9LACO|nr:WxL domain-containing protein [Levilactobacillus tujiorum]MCH5465297.1 WxL domain-containing protein [Levilactobacillus tujiorum]NLR12288.1 WxL domain-containing protein [Lactobacillus sp. HBUAS51387]NLR30300.1 WxL domain-containing protein [Levilactobacillus tujiorum]
MKKTVSSILLASALLLGTIAPVTANAADTTDTGTGLSGTTNSTVTFAKPASTTTPVDPTDPTKPIDPTDPDNPGGNGGTTPSGDLTFLYVSDSIAFGSKDNPIQAQTTGIQNIFNGSDNGKDKDGNALPANSVTVNNKNINTNKTLLTEVSDTRGSNNGWVVSVGSSTLAGKDSSGNSVGNLDGAAFNLQGSKATLTNSASTDGITGEDTVNGTTGIPADGKTTHTIYTAAKGHGAGSTAMQLDPSNVVLSVPANVKAGTYSGTLNWTLADTPAE